MKYRDHKQFAPQTYYHIYNRGSNKMDIFLGDQDFRLFLLRLKEYLFPERMTLAGTPAPAAKGKVYIRKPLPSGGFTLISYCLMPNHFHFLLRQNTDLSVSKLISKICTSYSIYFNKHYERVGGVFQDQFKAVPIENDAYLFWLSAYIHQNPKVALLVANPEEWHYSSYKDYIGQRRGDLCDKIVILNNFKSTYDYQSFVESSYEKIKQRKELEALLLD